MQLKYTCITKQGKWEFFADNDIDAMRKALWFCWRDGEDFVSIQLPNNATLRICMIDKHNSIQTL